MRSVREQFRRLLCASAAAALLSFVGSARADQAQDLFDQGLADMLAGKLATGCTKIAESQQLDPRPGTLFTLAECYAKAGQTASAFARYDEFLKLYTKLKPAEKRAQKERVAVSVKARAALLPTVPKIEVVLPGSAPSGTIIKMDGAALERNQLGSPMMIDPGEHVFVTQVPGGPAVEQRTTVRRGEQQRIELVAAPVEVEKRPTTTEPPTTEEPPRHDTEPESDSEPEPATTPPAETDHSTEGGTSQRTWGYILGGVGIAGLAVGGVTGALVLKDRSAILQHCPQHGCDNQGAVDMANRAKTLGLVSTVGFAVGGVALVTGVVLLVTDHSPPNDRTRQQQSRAVRLDVAPGTRSWSVMLHGAF